MRGRLLFFCFALLLFAQIGFAWWSDGNNWTLRKPITINGSASALTDYHVKIELNWTSGMNTTFTDLRFTDNSTNGVSLSYWIENYTASVNATVWVKINLTAGNNTIYVYYNNTIANSLSNGTNTFSFFDDFDSGTIDTTKWTTGGTGIKTITNGWLVIKGTNADWNTGIIATSNQTRNISVNWLAKNNNSLQIAAFVGWGNIPRNAGDLFGVYHYRDVTPGTLWMGAYGMYTSIPTLNQNISEKKFRLDINDTTISYFVDNYNYRNYTNTTLSNNAFQISNLDQALLIDNVFIRKYTSPEPTVLSVGVEEGQDSNPPSINIQSPLNKTYNAATIDLNFTLSENASSCIYELDGVNTTISNCQNISIILNIFNYQASANNSLCSGIWHETWGCSNLIDNDFTTYGASTTGNTANLFANYTKEDGVTNNSKWEIVTNTGRNNLTIPASCWAQNPIQFQMLSTSAGAARSEFYCFNSTNWVLLLTKQGSNDYNIYEDGMYWAKIATNPHSVKVWANDTSNNWNVSSTIYFTVDTTAPTVSIQLPANTTYASTSQTLNFTASDSNGISSCKYELNGAANVTLAGCANTSFTAVSGSNTIRVYVNDTANNWNSSMVSFTVDITPPHINIQLPANTTYATTGRSLSYTVSDDIGVSQCKYELNGGANVSLATCQNTTFTAIGGSNSIKIWANDTANNWNVSATVYFTVDNTPPVITIQAPTNQTYGTVSVALNYTVSDDQSVSQCKYELNGAANVSLSGCANTTITAVSGNNTIKVWANDTANNWGVSSTVAFKVDTVFPVWTIGSFPKSDNSTVVNGSIVWDARVSDANLYRILLNVTYAANGSSVYSLYESDWNLTEYNFTGTTDTSGWAEGKYVAEFSATDDHTFGGLRGLNYTVDGYKMFFGNGKTNYSFAFQTKNPSGSITPLAMSADLSTLVSYNSTRKEYKWGYALKLPNPSFRATVFLNSSTDRIVLRNASMAHFVIGEFYVDFKDVLQAGYLLNVSNGSGGYFIDIWKESYGVSPNTLITIDPVSGGTNTQTEFYSFNVDHTVPTIVLNSPANNSWTSNNTPIFNVTTTDNIAASGSCNLTVDAVRMAAGTWTNNTPFTMSNTTALAAGTHYWNATCVDSAGNLKTSQTFAVSIDTVNPNVVCIACPVSSSTSSLTFSVTATDALSGVNVSRLFYRGAYYTMSKSGDTYSYSLTENNNGEYSYQFFVNDTAGNLNSTVTGSVVVGASTSSPPSSGGGGGGGGGEALTVADLLGKLQNLTQQKPFIPSENVSYIPRPAADVTSVNLSALVFDYTKLGDPYFILPTSSPIQQYVSNFPKWSVLVPISAITGLISTAAFGGGWGGAVWVIATYFEGYWIADLNTWVNVNGTLVALNSTVGG